MFQLAQMGHHLMLRARSTSRRRPFHSRPSMWRTACTSEAHHCQPSRYGTAHTIGDEDSVQVQRSRPPAAGSSLLGPASLCPRCPCSAQDSSGDTRAHHNRLQVHAAPPRAQSRCESEVQLCSREQQLRGTQGRQHAVEQGLILVAA